MLSTEIRQLLDDEYTDTLRAISGARTGTDEAKWQLQKLAELHRQRMSEEQADRESRACFEELELKRRQFREDMLDRFVKVVIDGIAIVVPCAVSSYWMAKGLKFEETGSFTSRAGNWVSSHLRLFRK